MGRRKGPRQNVLNLFESPRGEGRDDLSKVYELGGLGLGADSKNNENGGDLNGKETRTKPKGGSKPAGGGKGGGKGGSQGGRK